MQIRSIKLWNFRCFTTSDLSFDADRCPVPVEVDLERATTVFIGRNGAGKSALLQALLRLFGETRDERSIQPGDFFVPPTERLETQPIRRLFIEAVLSFPELVGGDTEAEKTVPPVFRHMIVEAEAATPYARIRLEATWQLAGTLDGVVEESLYWILSTDDVAFGDIDPLVKKKVSASERSTVLVRYIPASRDITALTQLTVRSLGRSLMRSVVWERKDEIAALVDQAASELDREGALTRVNEVINACWSQLNMAETGTAAKLSVLTPDLQQIVRSASITLTPSTIGRTMGIEELSDGQRSLFHFALVKALLDLKLQLEAEIAKGGTPPFQLDFARAPALTIFAFEEPENHLSPYFLSRLLSELEVLTKTNRVQGVVTSHAPAIVGRIEPIAIRYIWRTGISGISTVARLALPEDDVDAAKFVREAVRAHPEIYFARHAVFGEGASEEIILPRLAEALGVPIDRSFVAIVPVGGRHILHFWRLVAQLGIPHTTLLDLDLGRSTGDILQFNAAARALYELAKPADPGSAKNLKNAIGLTRPKAWGEEGVDRKWLEGWVAFFETQGVFMSGPLDLDMMMLSAFPSAYKKLPVGARGPQSPDDTERQLAAAKRVLGEDGLGIAPYEGTPEMALFPWYAYLFLGTRGKPAAHLSALGEIDSLSLELFCPPVLERLIKHVKASLEAPTT